MAKSDAKTKKDKTKGSKKAKKADAVDGLSVAGHPRAAAQVNRAKGLGGIVCFLITAYYSYKAGVPLDQVALRAVGVGVAGYMLAWACAVTVWRHLVLAELRAVVESRTARPQGDSATAAEAPTQVQPAGAGAE